MGTNHYYYNEGLQIEAKQDFIPHGCMDKPERFIFKDKATSRECATFEGKRTLKYQLKKYEGKFATMNMEKEKVLRKKTDLASIEFDQINNDMPLEIEQVENGLTFEDSETEQAPKVYDLYGVALSEHFGPYTNRRDAETVHIT